MDGDSPNPKNLPITSKLEQNGDYLEEKETDSDSDEDDEFDDQELRNKIEKN